MRGVWRLVIDDARDGIENMALDRAMQLAREAGESPATVRLYRWARPTLSLGRFQDVGSIDLDVCRDLGVEVVRRHTGGRGVLHDDEMTYSIVASTDDGIPRATTSSYRVLSSGLVRAYSSLGVDAELVGRPRGIRGSSACYLHSSPADLSVGRAKLSGSAQVWAGDTCLQHGSITRSRDISRETAVFGLDDAEQRSLAMTAFTLEDVLGTLPSFEQIAQALVKGFGDSLGVRLDSGSFSEWEHMTAARLAGESVV
ncbi:MAG: lipoate--protein ligase family protein [Actinomycetota bacterium]|nr:lipoate--protein ligase family protein [Actinomycetota bacterium]